MAQNPYEKGTMEYLDWATAQHDEAMKPKPKKKKAVKKKTPKVVQKEPEGLAQSLQSMWDQETARRNKFTGM